MPLHALDDRRARRRLKLGIGLFVLALVVPSALLVLKAYDQMKWESFRAQQLVAEDLPIYWINVVPYHTVYHQGLGNVPMSIWGAMAPLDQVYWDTPPE